MPDYLLFILYFIILIFSCRHDTLLALHIYHLTFLAALAAATGNGIKIPGPLSDQKGILKLDSLTSTASNNHSDSGAKEERTEAMASLSVVDNNVTVPVGKIAAFVSEEEVKADAHTTSSSSRYLVVSPYTEQDHLLDLDTLDAENQILAEALVAMKPVREDYATYSYLESFNWEEVMRRARELTIARGHDFKETSWYIVAFRSQIKPTTEYPDLGVLDKAAHAEATASGGFLK